MAAGKTAVPPHDTGGIGMGLSPLRRDMSKDHSQHTHEIIKAVKRPVNVEVDGVSMPFGYKGAFRVKDPGVADEIRAKYGGRMGDVTVTRVKYPPPADQGHKYFFAVPALPWHEDEDA